MNKHKTSDSKQLVAFMRLFIDDGYALDDSSPTYKDNVRQLGERALQEITAFLSAQGIRYIVKGDQRGAQGASSTASRGDPE
ncbi:hypothetical protein P3T76_007419 [Phytophthora citrophthora]|uniref:Uncharacterized protein n=1 Tax=Phytophthora citrophthora TaxID=4793 RepID=A0AAD9GNU8_9STRA|nr:hypothetical protein P3T76_007419 [Phytophthora citrophthora]